MNLKQIIIGVFLAPLSFSQSVNAQTSPSVISFEELNSQTRSSGILQIAQNEREYQLEILEQALGVANTLEDLSERVHLFSEIAIEYADFGQIERALEIFSIAQELANTIEDTQERNILLSELALKEAELQPRDIALQRLSTALNIANDIEDLQKRTRLLSQIALKLTKLGESDRAETILAENQGIIDLTLVPEAPQLFPFQPIPWTGRVGLASNFFSGNKTTSLAAFSFGLERKWPTDDFDLSLNLTNDFDDSRVDPQLDNQFKGSLNAEYRHHASARWQYFIYSGARRDDLDNINVRSSLYTGPGINLWRAPGSRTLDMQLGLGVRFEDSNRRSNDFDAPVAQYRLRYKDIFFEHLRLRQFFTFELPFGDLADYYMESSTNLAIPIVGGWSFSNFLRVEYAGQPTLNNPNVEVNLQTGLEYQF